MLYISNSCPTTGGEDEGGSVMLSNGEEGVEELSKASEGVAATLLDMAGYGEDNYLNLVSR
jgi:hypothetical protein